jgi:hypothetical protein
MDSNEQMTCGLFIIFSANPPTIFGGLAERLEVFEKYLHKCIRIFSLLGVA